MRLIMRKVKLISKKIGNKYLMINFRPNLKIDVDP